MQPTSNRREFLKYSAGAALLRAPSPRTYFVRDAGERTFLGRLAPRELLRGLMQLRLPGEVRFAGAEVTSAADDLLFQFRLEPLRFRNSEQYTISSAPGVVTFEAGGARALLYAVFDFLERQGAFFGIDGESYPVEPPRELVLPPAGQPWTAAPRFAVRGLLPWPDFLNCITVYNEEDFRAYFENMLRMRFNTFGMHVYTGAEQWAESYLSFEYAGVGHEAYLDSSATRRWGYLPQRTSRYTMGASQFYAEEVFGSDATRGRDPWETAEKTQAMLKAALKYARRLGIAVGVGFEPYQIPDEIWRALPPEAKPAQLPKRSERAPRIDIESVTARKMIETRLGQLLEAYPDVDHVWLWEDEGANWASRRTGIPISATPFLQAHDFLRRHAPKKRLVVSGWGGVARHFEDLHRRLPMDITFSCLSDSLGWDPVPEVFGKLEGRERWPIPWLEDDPAMWLAQFHVHRFEKDMNLAETYGCQGLIGIHWRHRIVDPTAGFQARFSWDKNLRPSSYYGAYGRSQASGVRAGKLATLLDEVDRDRKLLSTFSGEFDKEGHAVQHEYSGDYGEAFNFWANYEPAGNIRQSQKQAAEALRAIASSAPGALEKERLGYLAGHLDFMVPYTECWIAAHRIHGLLAEAGKLKQAGDAEAARRKVSVEAAPLWLEMAPRVREAMLTFQRIVATRNDLGTLASKHNKFVRLALVRLRLSMQEYLGELPPETEAMFAEVTRPDADAPPRVFVPTRPTMLGAGETVRILIVATGIAPVRNIAVHTRSHRAGAWAVSPARLLGRRTYAATLGPLVGPAELTEYFVSAVIGNAKVTAPLEAPVHTYALTKA